MNIIKKVGNRTVVFLIGLLTFISFAIMKAVALFFPAKMSLPIMGFIAKSVFYIGLTGMRVMYFLHPTKQRKAEIDNVAESMRIIDTLDINELIAAEKEEGKKTL